MMKPAYAEKYIILYKISYNYLFIVLIDKLTTELSSGHHQITWHDVKPLFIKNCLTN